MRWAILGATLVACGGEILDVPSDAGSEGASNKDAGKDAVVDVVFDVKQLDSPPPPSPTCAVSTSGLLAYYPLDNDTKDHSGNGNDALGKNLVQTQGMLGNAMAFDGSTSVLQVASGAAVLNGPRTLCAWMQVKPTTGLAQPVFSAGLPPNMDFYSLSSMAPTGACPAPPMTPFVEHFGSACVFEAGPPIMQGPWQLVCYAFDGARMSFVSDGFFAPPVPAVVGNYPLTTLFIGSDVPGNSKTTTPTFTGILDEVSVWSVFLSPNDVQALWNNGKGCPL